MQIPFLDLQAQYRSLRPQMDDAIQRVLNSSAYALGPSVEAFEKAFAAYCGVKHCICVNSGTSSITLILEAYGIGEGDEVITVANSFFASAEAISNAGATPVLVDCEAKSGLMDVTKLEAAITPKTKAILPVHLYGQCADMDMVRAVADRHGLLVFEDAAQAHGATYKGKRAGALGDAGSFSFYAGKNLGAYGEGGAVTTNNDEVAKTIRMLREHGSAVKYHHDLIGYNERMDGIQGAVLGVKLPHLDGWNARRRELAALYRELLPEDAIPMIEHSYGEGVYHLFVVRIANRDRVQKDLATKGIATGIHYPVPIHLQKAYTFRGWKQGDFPVAESMSNDVLSLPMYPEMTEEMVRVVCLALESALRGN
jgi:dTDP-4-amino-4,6-dideoxygalactose transaminase